MPQMSPINWLSLFFMFSVIFVTFNIMNYYLVFYFPLQSKISGKNSVSMNWKW